MGITEVKEDIYRGNMARLNVGYPLSEVVAEPCLTACQAFRNGHGMPKLGTPCIVPSSSLEAFTSVSWLTWSFTTSPGAGLQQQQQQRC